MVRHLALSHGEAKALNISEPLSAARQWQSKARRGNDMRRVGVVRRGATEPSKGIAYLRAESQVTAKLGKGIVYPLIAKQRHCTEACGNTMLG